MTKASPHTLRKTGFACLLLLAAAPAAASYEAIPLDGFADIIKHRRDRTGETHGARTHYRPEQIVEIADNLLLYQRSSGGWPVNKDPLRILDAEERVREQADKNKLDTSFDNRNTWPQIEYLARVYRQTRDARHRDAALRGIEFILDSQYPNGGWPHSFPGSENYHAHITFMDEVMPGMLGLLRRIVVDDTLYEFVDAKLRKRIRKAIRKGDKLILRLQIIVDGKPTAWAGQYDRRSLQPVTARSYELPGLVSRESVAVVRYLMSIEKPDRKIVRAIDSAVDWFKKSRIHGMRIEEIPAEPVKFKYYTSTHDLKIVADRGAPPIWARFYEIKTNRPFMANRDGAKVYSLAEVQRERRTGYDWYNYYPAELLQKDYPAWQVRNKKIYFSFSGWAELVKYDSRTRIYEKVYCDDDRKDIKLRIPKGIVNVELIVSEAIKIVLGTEYEDEPEELAGIYFNPPSTDLTEALVDEEICVVSPCFPPIFEYGIGKQIVKFEQDCPCFAKMPLKHDEMEALFQLLDSELDKYPKIAGLHKDSGCVYY